MLLVGEHDAGAELGLIWAATASSRTVKGKTSGMAPGRFAIAISPSQVLQTQPFFENFCT